MGEIKFVGTGETCGYPYLVCKKRRCFNMSIFELSRVGFPSKSCVYSVKLSPL